MAFTLFRIVFVLVSIAHELRCVFCDENLIIDLRKNEPEVHSDFKYDQIISDDQLELFQLDGNKGIDIYQKAFPKESRPICSALKGLCPGGIYLFEGLRSDPETKVYVRINEYFKNISSSKEPKHVQFLSHTFMNNGTKKVKWTPPSNEFTFFTHVTRTHAMDTNKSAWSMKAGTTFLTILTATGTSFRFELSDWSVDDDKAEYLQMDFGSISEIEVDPGETVEVYAKYKETSCVLELGYRMTIGNDYTWTVEYDREINDSMAFVSRPYHTLSAIGMPTSFIHRIKLELTYPADVKFIKSSKRMLYR